MRHLTKDNLVTLGILVAGIAATILVVYLPQSREREKLETEIARTKNSLTEDGRKASVVPTMLKQVAELRREFSGWDRQLPTSTHHLGSFLKQISIAHDGIISEGITAGQASREKLYRKLPIILHFRGSFLAVANFLERVHKMERLTRVNKLEINTAAEQKDPDGPPELEVEVHLNIYFREV